MAVGLGCSSLLLRHPLDSALVPKHIGLCARQMLYQFVSATREVSDDEKLARSNMEQSRFNLAPHEAVFEIIVNDIPCSRLHGYNPHLHLLIVSITFSIGLCNTEKVSSCRGTPGWALNRASQSLNIVNVGALRIK